MKRYIKRILLILGILLIGYGMIAACSHKLQIMKNDMSGNKLTSFRENQSALHLAAKEYLTMFEDARQAEPALVRIHVYGDENALTLHYVFPEESQNRRETIPCPETLSDAMKAVRIAFGGHKYGSLDGITIHENQVAFRRAGLYAFVYTKDGARPRYIVNSDTDKILTERAGIHWFHCLHLES